MDDTTKLKIEMASDWLKKEIKKIIVGDGQHPPIIKTDKTLDELLQEGLHYLVARDTEIFPKMSDAGKDFLNQLRAGVWIAPEGSLSQNTMDNYEENAPSTTRALRVGEPMYINPNTEPVTYDNFYSKSTWVQEKDKPEPVKRDPFEGAPPEILELRMKGRTNPTPLSQPLWTGDEPTPFTKQTPQEMYAALIKGREHMAPTVYNDDRKGRPLNLLADIPSYTPAGFLKRLNKSLDED